MRTSKKIFYLSIGSYQKAIVFIALFVILSSCASEDTALKEGVCQIRKDLREVKVELNKKDPEPEPEETVTVSPPMGRTYKNSLGMEFIEIPEGEFFMGCVKRDTNCLDDEKPQHKVKIRKSFYMGKFEVTQGQWKKLMGNNPSYFENCGEDCPVETVSWIHVQEFISKLCKREKQNPCKYRLPTEAEWEYAARAGGSTRLVGEPSRTTPTGDSKYYWGESINDGYLWYAGNSGNTTHPVGKKKPNAWGLYDMSGNVWEWVDDLYYDSYYKKSSGPDFKGPNSGSYRVGRGGSWYDGAEYCRLSYRDYNDPGGRYRRGGFRLILLP